MATFETGVPSSSNKPSPLTRIFSKSPDKFSSPTLLSKNASKLHESKSGVSFDKSYSITRSIAEMKERRKLVDSNAQMLSNRLQALSNEENKLKRNTLNVQHKSQQLLQHRLVRDQQVFYSISILLLNIFIEK